MMLELSASILHRGRPTIKSHLAHVPGPLGDLSNSQERLTGDEESVDQLLIIFPNSWSLECLPTNVLDVLII